MKKFATSFISVATYSIFITSNMIRFALENAINNQIFQKIHFLIPLSIMLVFFYFIAIRPQKKREQEKKDLQNSLNTGDEIVTTGGIIGIVIRVGDDNVVIETGGDRNKLRVKKWAIAENITYAERVKKN